MAEILNFIVIGLLIVAIIYGFILNRRIMLIQESKKELTNLFKSFDNTILKAQIGIDDLKHVSREVSEGLQEKITKATIVADDLSFLSEKAVEITNAMEKKVLPVKKMLGNTSVQQMAGGYEPNQIKSIKQNSPSMGVTRSGVSNVSPADKAAHQKRAKVLEGLLEKISETGDDNNSFSNKQPPVRPQPKTVGSSAKKGDVVDMLKALGYGE